MKETTYKTILNEATQRHNDTQSKFKDIEAAQALGAAKGLLMSAQRFPESAEEYISEALHNLETVSDFVINSHSFFYEKFGK